MRSRTAKFKSEIGMVHSPENEPTASRIELGRRLFYDPVLSLDSTISCASCHKQEFAFADNRTISPGVQGRLALRNAPTLANVGFNPTVLFDGFLKTLEMQVLVPIEEHAEMDHNIVLVAERLKNNPNYIALSQEAYNRDPDPFVITRSISLFERTLISNSSKFDKFLSNQIALTMDEKKGFNLFLDKGCVNCHRGNNFTDYSVKNNGLLPNLSDSGRMRVTNQEEDRDLFKVPTLRNIALTAPYMHDGRFQTLDQVVEHYASGGQPHQNKSRFIQPFKITDREMDQLISFLKTLTDSVFITEKKYGPPNPW